MESGVRRIYFPCVVKHLIIQNHSKFSGKNAKGPFHVSHILTLSLCFQLLICVSCTMGSLPAPYRLPAQCKPRHRGQLLVELRTVLQNCISRSVLPKQRATDCNSVGQIATDCNRFSNCVSNSTLMCRGIVTVWILVRGFLDKIKNKKKSQLFRNTPAS